MQFNNYSFILYFVPIVIVMYFGANKLKTTYGKMVLVAASIIFYAWGRINFLPYLGISILISYGLVFISRQFKLKSKVFMAIPIIINVGLLVYFKYWNFINLNFSWITNREFVAQNIVLPLGISFYTFQQIAYIVAVQKEEIENVSLIDYLVYILYFPKLIMGPLMDPVDFVTQINDTNRKEISVNNIASGIKIFSFGLINNQVDYEADYYATALLNKELTGVEPLDVISNDKVQKELNNAEYISLDNGEKAILCQGTLDRDYSIIELGDYLRDNDYIGIKFTINLDEGYNYLCFDGKKVENNARVVAYFYDQDGAVVYSYEVGEDVIDNEKHMYAVDLSTLQGKVTVIINGGATNNTSSPESEFELSNIVLY